MYNYPYACLIGGIRAQCVYVPTCAVCGLETGWILYTNIPVCVLYSTMAPGNKEIQ